MTLQNYGRCLGLIAASVFTLATPMGCGNDQSMYQNETLTIESPVSGKQDAVDNVATELDLSEDQKSDFGYGYGYGGPFGLYPWGGFPFYDYYLDPLPLAVPVAPGFGLWDYIHPFYAYRAWDPFWNDDDDSHHSNDDDF